MAVGAALSLWKAPSRGNRHAPGVRIAREHLVRSDSPKTWKTLAPSRPGWPDHAERRTRFPLFPHAHLDASALLGRPQTPTRPGHTMPNAKTNAVSIVTVLHTEFLTVLRLLRRQAEMKVPGRASPLRAPRRSPPKSGRRTPRCRTAPRYAPGCPGSRAPITVTSMPSFSMAFSFVMSSRWEPDSLTSAPPPLLSPDVTQVRP